MEVNGLKSVSWPVLAVFITCLLLHETVSVDVVGTSSPVVVQTTYGKVRGFTKELTTGVNVDIFHGIPYAKPPVGPLRFKKPEPPQPWTGVKDVTKGMSVCVQSSPPKYLETEDCLHLDVYSPKLDNSSKSLPVMLFIHGGGFQSGSKNWLNGTLLASEGVVVVIINYRLGPFGFLSTEDDVIPGNFGNLDQIESLKWVKSNIALFGGDPNSVTLFGESAGSACISMLIASPLAKGLFHRAIMQSGVSTGSRAVPPPMALVSPKDMALSIGNDLGCGQSPGPAFLTCLQNQDVDALFNASKKASALDKSSGGKYRPRVETTFGFLPDYPLNLYNTGKFNRVDMMRGFNSQEQGAGVKDWDHNGLTVEEFRNFAMKQLKDFPYLDSNTYLKRMEDVYLANVTDPFVIRSKAIAMKSDFTFIAPIVLETKISRRFMYNEPHTSYLYNFDYLPSYQTTPDYVGVIHAINGPFSFGLAWNFIGTHKQQTTPDDERVAGMIMKMWSNFAKFGHPTPVGKYQRPLIYWNEYHALRPSYLKIDTQLEVQNYNTTENVNVLNLYRDTEREYVRAIAGNTAIVG